MLSIRRANLGDSDWVFNATKKIVNGYRSVPPDMEESGGEQCFKDMLNDPEHHYIAVAEAGKKKVGVVFFSIGHALHFGGKAGEVQGIYVDESCRNLGVGRALMKHLDDFAIKNGIKAIDLYQLPPGSDHDEERHMFYKRHGYVLGGFVRHKIFKNRKQPCLKS